MTKPDLLLQQLQLNAAAEHAYRHILQQLDRASLGLPYPAVIGISGAQGSGKSTLAAELVAQLQQRGVKAAAVSLDDYYLSQAQRQHLANQVHPLLKQRGVPGTHNIQQAIRDAKAVLAGQRVALPQFDKASDEPGIALAPQQLDILLVEGWCLGVAAQTAAELAAHRRQA